MPKMGDLAKQDDYGDVDWSRMNQPFGQLLDPNPKLYDTKAGPIYQADINQAIDVGMGVSGGGLATKGIKAYHSSPHDFDRFDLSKIGTGEGAQAYGHGLYFAEHPAVSGQGGQYWGQFLRRFEGPENAAAVRLGETNFDRAKAIKEIENEIQALRENPHDYSSSINRYQREIELLRSGKPVGPRTYEVDIKADPAHMLDWDKAMTSQSPQVLKTIEDMAAAEKAVLEREITGRELYQSLNDKGQAARTSAALKEAGIPGIKYLDQQSRDIARRIATEQKIVADPNIVPKWRDSAAENLASLLAQKQTSNYVMFDPNIIDIRKVYGIAGAAPAAMGALAAQDSYQPEEKM